MNMNEYQKRAGEYSSHGDESHQANPGTRDHFSMVGLGITGEAGEFADLVKKILFHGHVTDIQKLKKELGDVLWYVQEGARAAGLTLDDVAKANLDKLALRYPEGRFSVVRSRQRAPNDE